MRTTCSFDAFSCTRGFPCIRWFLPNIMTITWTWSLLSHSTIRFSTTTSHPPGEVIQVSVESFLFLMSPPVAPSFAEACGTFPPSIPGDPDFALANTFCFFTLSIDSTPHFDLHPITFYSHSFPFPISSFRSHIVTPHSKNLMWVL